MSSLDGHEKTMAHADEVLAAFDALSKVTSRSEHKWHWDKLRAYAVGLFDRAPFKPGDRVRLTRTPDITPEKAWGWMGSRHFLLKGAMGTVVSTDFSDGHFEAYVVFDDESWRDNSGVLHKPVSPAQYHFWETSLERVAEEAPKEPE